MVILQGFYFSLFKSHKKVIYFNFSDLVDTLQCSLFASNKQSFISRQPVHIYTNFELFSPRNVSSDAACLHKIPRHFERSRYKAKPCEESLRLLHHRHLALYILCHFLGDAVRTRTSQNVSLQVYRISTSEALSR